jgi:hypothetical protein
VDALIDESAAAVEGESAAPAGIGVIVRRAIPLHVGGDKQHFAKVPLLDPILELADVGLGAVLKDHAELDIGLFCGGDESVGAFGGDFDGFFREDVEVCAGGGDALRGMEAGGAAEDNEIHGAMAEESVEILIRRSAVFVAKVGDFFRIGAVYGGDFYARDSARGASVGFGDVTAADEADVGGHLFRAESQIEARVYRGDAIVQKES